MFDPLVVKQFIALSYLATGMQDWIMSLATKINPNKYTHVVAGSFIK